MKLLQCYIDNIINTALMEDINYIDEAADNLISPEHRSRAYYVAKDTGVLCGIEVAKRVFELVGGDVDFHILLNDGAKVKKGDVLCIIEAMKIMNEVVSDFDGEVKEVLAENEQLVEFGAPLFRIG